jgi:hypothetical protein
MEQQQNQPVLSEPDSVDPVVLPDVATEPHPTAHTSSSLPDDTGVGDAVLQEVLPQIAEAARKVGGYKRLAEIATQLDRAGVGQ